MEEKKKKFSQPDVMTKPQSDSLKMSRKISMENSRLYGAQEQEALGEFTFGDISESSSLKSPEFHISKTSSGKDIFAMSGYHHKSFRHVQSQKTLREERKFSLEETTASSKENQAKKSTNIKVETEKPILSKNVKLSEIFKDRELRDLFLKFSLTEFSSENLYFTEELKVYKSIENKEEKLFKLQEIHEKFLSDGSLMQINVQKDPILKIEKILETQDYEALEEDLFKTISEEVNSLMKDTLSRFRESQDFEEYRNASFSDFKPLTPTDDGFNLPRKSVSDVLKSLFVRRDSTSSFGSASSTRSKKREKRTGSGSSVDTEKSMEEYSGLSDFKM